MITLSSREKSRHEVDGVTYAIQTPTLMGRALYRREVAATGAVMHTNAAMMDCLRDGVNEAVAEDQRGELIEIINSFEYEAGQRADDSGMDAAFESLADQVKQIEDFIRTNYPRYAQMEADRGYWLLIAPIIAFRCFVTDIDDSTCKRMGGMLSEAAIEKVDEKHIAEVGWKVIEMMTPSKDEVKNSEPQLSLPSDQPTSTAGKRRRTGAKAGKSGEKSTQPIQH